MQTVLTGRLTADARITELADGRKVVNFSIAQSRTYTVKGSKERRTQTTYVRCASWLHLNLAPYLKKGATVATTGFLGLDTWVNPSGEAKGTITQQVSDIQLFGKSNKTSEPPIVPVQPAAGEDLPF